MNIDRYKSVEPGQYNENNFGRTSGERSFPVRHGCHPIHESSLDSRGSYVSDSSEKLNRIPPLPLPRDGLAPSKSVPLAPKPPPNRPQTDSTAVLSCSPFQQATTIFWLRGSVHARRLRRCTTRSGGRGGGRQSPVYGIQRPNKCRICKIGGP